MFAILKLPITTPTVPILGTVSIVGATALSIPLERPSTGPTTLAAYELERSTDDSIWDVIASGPTIFGESFLYADTGLTESTAYFYRARAVDTTGRYSAYSASVTSTTPSSAAVDAPVSVAVVQSGAGLSISWGPGQSGADSYVLYRKGAIEANYWARSVGSGTTYLDTGMPAGSTWSYYVTATLGGNDSGPSSIVTGTTATGSGAIKWNPGFYIFLAPPTVDGVNGAYIDSAAARASNLTWFQTYANDPKIKGFVIHQYILSLERGNSVPAYDYVSESGGIRYGGFACIDYYLGLCATYGKRLAVHLKPHAFAGATALPAYWISQGWEHRYYGDFNSAANIGINACRDRYIALLQAYGSRYDTNPYLEFTSYGETTISLPVGVTAATWISNYKAILSAAVEAWPSTMFRSNENGQINQATQKEAYEHIETLNNAGTGCILTGGPDHEDTLTDPYNPGNEKSWVQLWRGETTSLGTVWKDVRGLLPRVGETQERGYSNPSFYQDTAANILTYQIDYMNSSHVVFLNYNKWTETYAAITARSGLTDATVPTCLTGRTVTGGT